MRVLSLSFFLLAFWTTVAIADRPPAPVGGGIFRAASAESLGYDAFRELPAADQLDRRDEARDYLRRARDRAHASASAPTSRGRDAALREAVDACATAVGLVPYLPDAWVAYARHLNGLGDYAAADASLAHARHTMRYERNEGRRRELIGEAQAITAVVAFNLGQAERSRDAARSALEVEANDDETRLILVRALVQLEQFDAARQVVGTFEYGSPKFAQAQAVLGVLETDDGRMPEAEEAFDLAYEYGMRGAVFDNDRGRLFLKFERYDDAVEAFEAAIEAVPSFQEAWNNLAVAHRRAGRLERADAVLKQMLQEYPTYGPAHFNRAEILRMLYDAETDPDRARSLAAEVVVHYGAALDAGYEPETVFERRASFLTDAGDLETAEADLLRMTEDPDVEPGVLFMLGRVKKEQGSLAIALRLLRMAEERGYDSPRLPAEIGEVLARQGDLEGARDALRRAIASDDGSLVVTRVNLSVVLAQLGDLDGAEAALLQATMIDSDHPMVIRQQSALAQARAKEGDSE